MNKHNLQCKSIHDNKFKLMEQSIVEVKDELYVAISQKVNNIAEQVVFTRDANNDIELESFSCDNRVGGYTLYSSLIEYGNLTDSITIAGRYNYLKLHNVSKRVPRYGRRYTDCLLYTSRCV